MRLIISFWAVFLFTVTVTTAGAPSPEDKLGAVETAEAQKPLPGYQRILQKAIDVVFIPLVSLEKRKDIGLEEKQQIAIDFIGKIRWGSEVKNYFWIIDLEGTMILEPLYPNTEGKKCIMFKDLNNKKIFAEFIRTSHENEQGFINHHGLGYGDNKSNPRISFAKLFKPWGWVVGTGAELGDVAAYEVPEKVKFYSPLPPIDEEPPIDDEGPASPI